MNVAELPDDGLQPFLLGRREDEADELGEADSLVFALEHVLGVEGELENATPGVAALVLAMLDLAGDFPELLLDGPKVSLQLLQQGDGRGEALADLGRLIAGDRAPRP